MKAVGFTQFGGPEVLGVHDLADPRPGAGEVRIRVRAAAVNPTDISRRRGLFGADGGLPPYIPGTEAAGVIDAVGEGSTWQVGDAVMALAVPASEHGGAYAEYLVAPDYTVARIPAIQAAKRTGDWIPLCHPLPLTNIQVDLTLTDSGVQIESLASCVGRTGVEMEALVAASAAALTVYDMCKSADKGMVIGEIRLLEKTGGKSGDWKAAE